MMNRKSNKKKTPWPTKDAMIQIYEKNLWGRGPSEFYSGDGSHISEIVDPYIAAVTSFLSSFEEPIVVCDLGCGDFNLGNQLVEYTKEYKAIDIVPSLVSYNKKKYGKNNLEFHCLDIATDDLPSGDCAIVRQVLQHLSNKEVQKVLDKLVRFKYILLTEHLPIGKFKPNVDIISGQGVRIKKQSGLNILSTPFNFKVQEENQLLATTINKGREVIVTTCYRVF